MGDKGAQVFQREDLFVEDLISGVRAPLILEILNSYVRLHRVNSRLTFTGTAATPKMKTLNSTQLLVIMVTKQGKKKKKV